MTDDPAAAPWHHVPIDRGDVGIRIDRVLLRHLTHVPGVTRNRIQGLIARGSVRVNGRPIARAARRIAPGDEVAIALPERRTRVRPAAESIPIDIVYEDADLLVANKPAGQVSHPAFRHTTGTLLNGLLGYAGGVWTPALITRLDKGTSGLVLVAKSRAVQAALQQASSAHPAIEKDYLAIVTGKPPSKGTIDLALDRDPWDRRRVTVRDRGGVPSVTRFVRLGTVAAGGDQHVSLLRCRLITGRTHQIRVHLAARGWPIVGDAMYGAAPAGSKPPRLVPESARAMARQALHAWRLALTNPLSGQPIEVSAPLPDDMRALLSACGLTPP